MATATPQRKAIGIIRVSDVHGRNGDRFHSPAIQRERIERDCERWDLQLVICFDELDTSGGLPITRRRGLREALEWVEDGRAQAIVFAYRDRVDRSIEHGSELVRRMDAQGALLIADGKRITHATHDGWRTATLESFLNEDQRRAIGAKMYDVQRRAIEQGRAPHALPPGYRKRADGVAEFDPDTHGAILAAWHARAEGTSIPKLQRRLAAQNILLSHNTITRMFRNRFYLGELHYRVWSNLTAHEPMVDQETWDAVQAKHGKLRGRYSKDPALLARLGVVRCAECGGRMSVTNRGKTRPGGFYRCYGRFCDAKPTIDSALLEGAVLDKVEELCAGITGTATAAGRAQQAKADLTDAEARLSRLRRRLAAAGDEDEAEAIELVREAREARDKAQSAYDEALATDKALRVVIGFDREEISFDALRDLIVAVIKTVTVAKGKGLDRVTIEGNTL